MSSSKQERKEQEAKKTLLTCQVCTACGVVIENDTVHFSYGKSGTRDRLYARVCQYAKEQDRCANLQAKTKESFDPEPKDYWLEPKNLHFSFDRDS